MKINFCVFTKGGCTKTINGADVEANLVSAEFSNGLQSGLHRIVRGSARKAL